MKKIFFLSLAVFSCYKTGPSKTITVAEETLIQAKDNNFLYQKNAECAIERKRKCLQSLFEFSVKADTAGGIGHGLALLEILLKVGEDFFFKTLKEAEFNPKINKAIFQSLEIGLSYTRQNSFQQLEKNFPQLYNFMQQNNQKK